MSEQNLLFSQNLVLNSGAEGLPLGVQWTIVSTGANPCAAGTAAATYSTWTMTPDNSANYPAAHGGSKTFFAGCNTIVPAGTFELYQDVDVSADALQIDAGSISYSFSGYIQTPVPPQADAGRFIVDFMNSGGSVIGISYTSSFQSYSGCSCINWNLYSNVRSAPGGTRKIRIRLQSKVTTGPAINAYFDDISLTKTVVLPVVLESFTGKERDDSFDLAWIVSNAADFSRFEIDKSIDAAEFLPIATVNYNNRQADYQYSDKLSPGGGHIYYRLKMIDMDSRFVYSTTLALDRTVSQPFDISPNPAVKNIVITGLHNDGTITIVGINGKKLFESQVKNKIVLLDISFLPKGTYIVSYVEANSSSGKKLVVQ
jgi:Secretion system C-terminal sorting domain